MMFNFLLIERSVELDLPNVVSARPAISRKTLASSNLYSKQDLIDGVKSVNHN